MVSGRGGDGVVADSVVAGAMLLRPGVCRKVERLLGGRRLNRADVQQRVASPMSEAWAPTIHYIGIPCSSYENTDRDLGIQFIHRLPHLFYGERGAPGKGGASNCTVGSCHLYGAPSQCEYWRGSRETQPYWYIASVILSVSGVLS